MLRNSTKLNQKQDNDNVDKVNKIYSRLASIFYIVGLSMKNLDI